MVELSEPKFIKYLAFVFFSEWQTKSKCRIGLIINILHYICVA